MFDNWIEYLSIPVCERWKNDCCKVSDIVPLTKVYWKYVHPEKSASECLERIVGSIAEWNTIDIDPNNLDWNELLKQVLEDN